MGLFSGALAASEALNPIKVLGKQAVSYMRPMGKAGIRLSKQITKDALSNGLTRYAAVGAAAGAAGGAGYDYTTNGRSSARSMIGAGLKGAVLGGVAGGGARLGMSAYGARGSMAARGIGAGASRMGSTLKNAYRERTMLSSLERAAGVPGMGARASNAAAGYAKGAGAWAKGMAGDAGAYLDKARYYAGL